MNRFEQLCINYANEKLQQYFQHHVLGMEQEIYAIEEVSFKGIWYENNQPCVTLIEEGILKMLDDECRVPKGNDDSFLNKLNRAKAAHAYYEAPRLQRGCFLLKHFAGQVT